MTCRRPFTVKIGTVFESSHLELHLWLQAIYLVSFAKRRLTVRELQQTLGIARKTAWILNQRIRELITREDEPAAVVGDQRSAVAVETLARAETETADRDRMKPASVLAMADPSPTPQRPEAEESKGEPNREHRKRRLETPVAPVGSRPGDLIPGTNVAHFKTAPRPSRPAAPPDDPVQSDRFLAKAREIRGACESGDVRAGISQSCSRPALSSSAQKKAKVTELIVLQRAPCPIAQRQRCHFHSSLAKAEGLWKMLPECRADRELAEAWRISSVRPGGRFVRLSSKQRRYLVAKGGRL